MQKLQAFTLLAAFPTAILCFCHSPKPAAPVNKGTFSVTDSLPYNLESPSLTINLVSNELQEISGIGPADSAGVYVAIADERGEVFFIDGNGGGLVTHRILFREKGDFEGIEMVGKTIWALKSDGDLFEITDWKKSAPTVKEHKTPLKKSDDAEGLAYDHRRKSLLLACKGDPDSSYLRKIYAFNLVSKQLEEPAAYTINPQEVNRLVPYSGTEKHDYFSPSGIAIHPFSQDLYIVSTALKRLVVLDYQTGRIKFARRLDKKILPQPEGVSFDGAGNLLISSEGKQGEGLMLRFDLQKKK